MLGFSLFLTLPWGLPPSVWCKLGESVGNQDHKHAGTSLVVQWLRLHLPMQGTRVRSLVGELKCPTLCRGAKRLKRKEGANVFLWNLVSLHVGCVSESGPPEPGKKRVHNGLVAERGEQGERRATSQLCALPAPSASSTEDGGGDQRTHLRGWCED